MALLARITDFTPSTTILSGQVDNEFNQLVNILNATSTDKHIIVKFSDAAVPVLTLDQLSTGPIQQWKQAGVVVSTLKRNGQIVGVPKTAHTNSATIGNITTGLDDLHSFSLPAASLANDGDVVDVTYSGNFAVNNNDKRIVISFGGQTVDDGGLFDQDAGNWTYTIRYLRVSATTVRFALQYAWGIFSADGAQVITGNGRSNAGNGLLTVSDLGANAMVMKVQAEGTGTNDIVQNLSILQLTQNT